jgi:hypothetical protein
MPSHCVITWAQQTLVPVGTRETFHWRRVACVPRLHTLFIFSPTMSYMFLKLVPERNLNDNIGRNVSTPPLFLAIRCITSTYLLCASCWQAQAWQTFDPSLAMADGMPRSVIGDTSVLEGMYSEKFCSDIMTDDPFKKESLLCSVSQRVSNDLEIKGHAPEVEKFWNDVCQKSNKWGEKFFIKDHWRCVQLHVHKNGTKSTFSLTWGYDGRLTSHLYPMADAESAVEAMEITSRLLQPFLAMDIDTFKQVMPRTSTSSQSLGEPSQSFYPQVADSCQSPTYRCLFEDRRKLKTNWQMALPDLATNWQIRPSRRNTDGGREHGGGGSGDLQGSGYYGYWQSSGSDGRGCHGGGSDDWQGSGYYGSWQGSGSDGRGCHGGGSDDWQGSGYYGSWQGSGSDGRGCHGGGGGSDDWQGHGYHGGCDSAWAWKSRQSSDEWTSSWRQHDWNENKAIRDVQPWSSTTAAPHEGLSASSHEWTPWSSTTPPPREGHSDSSAEVYA